MDAAGVISLGLLDAEKPEPRPFESVSAQTAEWIAVAQISAWLAAPGGRSHARTSPQPAFHLPLLPLVKVPVARPRTRLRAFARWPRTIDCCLIRNTSRSTPESPVPAC